MTILAKAAAIFFNQAFRDGYFHGDQHPGNMSVGEDGAIQAVDFGIMGRIDKKTRFFLADMLMGFIENDYARVAKVYVDAGYLPTSTSVEDFTLALRSIGAPIHGRALHEISFARGARPGLRHRRDLRHGSAAAIAPAAEEHADGGGSLAPPPSASQHLDARPAADRAMDDRESRTAGARRAGGARARPCRGTTAGGDAQSRSAGRPSRGGRAEARSPKP